MKTKMKFTNWFFSVFCMVILLFSCSKEDGQDGAIGPAGPQGEQGPAGPQGSQGETGSPNVIYSSWINSEFNDNLIATGSSFTVDVPDLSEDILNNGVILGFGKQDTGLAVFIYQLPHITGDNHYFLRVTEENTIEFSVSSIDGTSVGNTFFDQYRYVLIPGGNTASGKSANAIDYSKMTYEEVIDYFNIPE